MFEDKTYEALLAALLSDIPDSTDKREGTLIYDALAPCAYRLAEVYLALEDVAKNILPSGAQRSYLAEMGENAGVPIRDATPAVLELTVAPSTCAIPTGTLFRVSGQSFSVSENRGGGIYAMTAEAAGDGGNIASGTATPATYISGLTSAGVTGILVAGTDGEDTEAYRARVIQAMKAVRFGGNKADYVAWAITQPGIAHARVTPPENSGGSILLEVFSDNYATVSAANINALQAALGDNGDTDGNGFAPIGQTVTVAYGHLELVSFVVILNYQTGADHAAVRQAVKDEIARLIKQTHSQWDEMYTSTLRQSDVCDALSRIPGVLGIPSVNMNNGDSIVQSTDLLWQGEVSVIDG